MTNHHHEMEKQNKKMMMVRRMKEMSQHRATPNRILRDQGKMKMQKKKRMVMKKENRKKGMENDQDGGLVSHAGTRRWKIDRRKEKAIHD